MRKPRECTQCGCKRKVIIVGARVSHQGREANEGFSQVSVSLAPLCVPCFFGVLGLDEQAKLGALPEEVTAVVEDQD